MSGQKVEFKYYLHASERRDVRDMFKDLARKNHLNLDSNALDTLQWNFYEVELTCELDCETLEVTIVGAK